MFDPQWWWVLLAWYGFVGSGSGLRVRYKYGPWGLEIFGGRSWFPTSGLILFQLSFAADHHRIGS